MEDIILAVLGPWSGVVLAASFALVFLARKAIARRHVVRLLAITVATFVAFFAFLVWGFTWEVTRWSALLYQSVLGVMAAVIVGCGSAIGFYFILMSVGLAGPVDDSPSRR